MQFIEDAPTYTLTVHGHTRINRHPSTLVQARTIVRTHRLTARTRTCAHSQLNVLTPSYTHMLALSHPHGLTLACTHSQAQSHTLSHTLSHTVTLASTYTCTPANLQAHSRAHGFTHIHSHACTHWNSFIHTILHTRALACRHSFVGFPTLPFSFSYAFAKRRWLPYFAIRCLKFSILWVTSLCLFVLQLLLNGVGIRLSNIKLMYYR